MQALNIKRIISFCITLILIVLLTGCVNDEDKNEVTVTDLDCFSVTFFNVFEGDCSFIRFANGKNMMIDTGPPIPDRYQYVKNSLIKNGITQIDYLLLTHTDIDHIGNAKSFIMDFTVKKLFVPCVLNQYLFTEFSSVMALSVEKGIEICYSVTGLQVLEDARLAFLSPEPTSVPNSFYNALNCSSAPTDEQINNVSAVVYLEYCGVRFLFTGDISSKVEEKILLDYSSNVYLPYVNLYNVDFMKVAHHGASDVCSKEFLQVVKPNNAIISVGAGNRFGHPSIYTLQRLQQANDSVNFFRTDLNGSIVVKVDDSGKTSIIVEREN